jgi:CobQ-like glutamine amidotransferase family enzyme
MKTINVLHLYYDLMNMYGENGNMRALTKALEKQELKVVVDFKSLGDKIDFNKYDIIYVGTGTDENYELAKDDLRKYANELKACIKNKVFILATGNALDLFSELKILNFKVKKIDFRIIGEQIYHYKDINKTVIGFQNRDKVIIDSHEKYLFDVINGTGYDINYMYEGINNNNFYGTYLLGPILIRNPYFLEYIIKRLMEEKNLEYKIVEHDISYKAYEEFLNNFVNKK